MAASSVLNKMRSMAQSIGVQALSGLYPNDFELYMIALELTDSEDNVIDYLSFPVNNQCLCHTARLGSVILQSGKR